MTVRDNPGNEGKRRGVLLAINWYHPKLHRGIVSVAVEHGWHLDAGVALGGNPLPSHWKGLGVITNAALLPKVLELYPWVERNVVLIDHPEKSLLPYHSVSDHHRAIADCAAHYLLGKGFTRFACYCPYKTLLGERLQRFRSVVEERGHNCEILIGSSTAWSERHTWLTAEVRKLPAGTAVFCQNDEFAMEVVEACLDEGIKIPGQVAVLGVRNDSLICESLHVPLSSVDNNLFGVGVRAAELLEKLMRGIRMHPRHHPIAPLGVKERTSTSLFAAELTNSEFHRAMSIIRDRFTDADFDCSELARRCSVSLRKLYQIFQASHDRSPGQEIRTLRVAKAKELLLYSRDPLEQLIDKCGFHNTRTLYKAFREIEGDTPASYRKSRTPTK